MANFAKLAATAKRLIDANGRAVTLIQQGNTPQDSAKKWRGLSEYPRAKVEGKAVFTKLDSDNPDNTKRKGQGMLFAANDDMGLRLEDFDVVQDGDTLWKIVSAEVVGPADVRVVYKFEVER